MPDNSPAKSFVKEKFEKYKIDKEFEEEANRCIVLIDDFFTRFAVEKKLENLKTDNLLLNASYLVEKERQEDFKEAFERTRRTPGDLKFLMSGPWPPYNFIVLTKKPDIFNIKPVYRNLTDESVA
jgi:glycosyltransferase involved in cell wall biosynthesis